MEKLVQTSYQLPRLPYICMKDYVQDHVLSLAKKYELNITGDEEELLQVLLNKTDFVQLFETPRDVIRLCNRLHVSVPNIRNEVAFADIIAFEMLELKFDEFPPIITTGSIKIELRYLFLIPIIYNSKVIAILELSGTEKPGNEVKEYIASVQEQLAIGLTNAIALVQLEKLVTELKQLNEDYQKQNVQIRKQNETLVDLHKKLKEKADELEIQKEKAVESTKLKSQFLASMSHELRTPMNSILGLTELILEENVIKGKNRDRIEVVLKSAQRLMNLINDILDLSKIEAGKMDLHVASYPVSYFQESVPRVLAAALAEKNILLEFRFPQDIEELVVRTRAGGAEIVEFWNWSVTMTRY